MVEVLVGRLTWAPETKADELPPSQTSAGADDETISALTLAEPPEAMAFPTKVKSSYSVPHYTEHAAGHAFGPLALDQVLRFCNGLDARLGKPGRVYLSTPPNDEADRTNAAVLLGAYLVLKCAWSPEQVACVLGTEESSRKFPCSFAPSKLPEPPRMLSVSGCWQGLALAKDRGWLDASCISSASLTANACERHRRLADTCDAAWIIPNRVLVCADPVTTAHDPNPKTFRAVFPETHSPVKLRAREASPSNASTSTTGSLPSTPTTQEEDLADHAVSCDTGDELGTGCMTIISQLPAAPRDWIALLQESGISMVIRTNAAQEQGMVERSYDGKKLGEFGIQHMDLTMLDGSTPSKEHVRRCLQGCSQFMDADGQGVLVHCKGGFGRSVLMACCLIIDRYDVPGASLLGWVRIARPGAVNTHRQEVFLQSIRGRADLRRYAGGGAQPACGPGQCSLQ